MRRLLLGCLVAMTLACFAIFGRQTAPTSSDQPRFTKNNRLIRPENYREWIYLSSGLGMEYAANASEPARFTNVFVAPSAYRRFLATGRWPENTTFVLEVRAAASEGSINKAGHYQADLIDLSASVKDSKRFPEGWAYFSFAADGASAESFPKPMCWDCHHEHGAVENTFVQFYPSLKPVAKKYGTYSEAKAAKSSAEE